MAPAYAEVLAQLTAPGAPFEMAEEEVRGLPMRCWRRRDRSLRARVAAAGARGDLPFLVQGERRLSYGDFVRLVWGAARALSRDHGLRRGDRLAVLAMNSPDWLVALFGAVSLGGIGVGLNGWWSAEELAYGLADSGSRFLVVDAKLWPRVEPVVRAGRAPSLERIFFLGGPGEAPEGTVPVDELLTPCDDAPDAPIDEDDPFVLLYTSGTTGRPKACITTHRGTLAQVTGLFFAATAGALAQGPPAEAARGGRPGQAVNLMTSPLFHVGGLHSAFCAGMSAGSRLVFTEGRFDPVQVMELVEREGVTHWAAIPTMLHRVVHHPDVGRYDLSSLRSLSFGGAPTPPETLARAREVLPVEPTLSNAYGLTETCGVATLNGGRDVLEKTGSVGRAMPLLDVEIRDETGKALPDGALGEICLYGPLVTPGYWNRPDATAETVRDGWLHTGDLGIRDADGFLWVVDRAKDMVIRGGENVYCVEIEHCLAEHPAVDEAAIVGVPDPELGEKVKAVVRVAPGASLSEDEVRRHVGAHLARFKVPELVELTDRPLPRNPAGKLLKNLLRGHGAGAFRTEDLEAGPDA